MATAQMENFWEGYLKRLIETKQLRRDSAHIYGPVYRAILMGEWEIVREFIQNHPDTVSAQITDAAETVLHKAAESLELDAISVTEQIVEMMSSEMLQLTDEYGNTALSRAALVGNVKIVRLMVKKNSKLTSIENKDGHTPLDHAARFGHTETVHFLLSVALTSQDTTLFSGGKGPRLLMYLISSNLFGITLDLLKHYPEILHHRNKDRKSAFVKLARKPLAFASGSQFGYWQSFIYYCIPLSQIDNPLLLGLKTSQCSILHRNDIENPEKSSTNLGKSSCYKVLRPSSVMLGAICQTLYVNFWRALVTLVPSIRYLHDKKLMHVQTLELTRAMIHGVNWSDDEAHETLRSLVVVAARLGNHEVVDEVIRVYPASVIYLDDDGRNIFQRAVMHRNEKVVNLLHQLPMVKQWVESFREYIPHFKTNNNILHLAARFGPSSRVPGAALQMQRELQWYKAVENLFHPSLQQEENKKYQTPRERFTEEHKDLAKAGEEWMKGTASSCTVVAALIITVVFAAAFTAPGGNNNDGIPNFAHEPSFLIFAVCDALALFSSTTSVLMFLGILTSRYAEDDFLMSLPHKLIIGLVTLFFSIATMMIAFGAALHLVLVHSVRWVVIPVALLACVPVSLFAGLQFPLLVEMIRSTYGPGFLQPQKR